MQDKVEHITMSAPQLAARLIGKRALVTKEALSKWIKEQQGKKPVEL